MTLTNTLERNIRNAIDDTPEAMNVCEREYCEATIDALGAVLLGVQMRFEEIREEEEDELNAAEFNE